MSKLAAAPWLYEKFPDGSHDVSSPGDAPPSERFSVLEYDADDSVTEAVYRFIALSRNAHAIMKRRGISPDYWGDDDGWHLTFDSCRFLGGPEVMEWTSNHPFECVVEADKVFPEKKE